MATGCDVCGRSFLPGERVHDFASPEGRHAVCELCVGRAERLGWVPWDEVGEEGLPARRPRRRLSLGGLFRRRRAARAERARGVAEGFEGEEHDHFEDTGEGPGGAEERPFDLPELESAADAYSVSEVGGPEPAEPGHEEPAPEPAAPRPEPAAEPDPAAPGRTTRRVAADPSPRSPFERGLERFNASEASRTVAGLARTLGPPWVSVGSVAGAAHEVRITVAWELCWYQWGVDLDDEARPVFQIDKGQELDQLDAAARQWNARAGEGGRITLGAGPVAEPAER